MTGSSTNEIADRLRAAISTDSIPELAAARAKRILQRLEAPIRIVFMGLGSSEQPRIINALLGEELLPTSLERPIQELSFGTSPHATITRSDGSVRKIDGVPDRDSMNGAIFIQRKTDAPALRQFTVLDLATGPSQAEMRGAVRWAAPKADIAVWCSGSFSPVERDFWSGVPESLMDHAFLALSDDPGGVRAAQLRSALGGEFRNVLSLQPDGSGTGGDLAISIAPLVAELERHVDAGRRADADGALAFLKKHEIEMAAPADFGSIQPARTERANVVQLETGASGGDGRRAAPSGCNPENQPAIRSGCAFIRERAGELLRTLHKDGLAGRSEITSRCGEMIRQLSEILDTAQDAEDPAIAALSEVLLEAEDLVVLLEIEQAGTPALDAASVLLQLRREFEILLAA